jgi:hypothetical protein
MLHPARDEALISVEEFLKRLARIYARRVRSR